MRFTHLEVHSHYTLLGATPSVARLVARAAADGLSHLALTDTHALYGAVAFARTCRDHGVQPVIGMTAAAIDAAGPEPAEGQVVLLARDPDGYRSLCRLASLLQGPPPGRRSLTWEDLRGAARGVVCLSGGCRGWVDRYLRAGDVSAAQMYAGRLAGIYGDDACLAVQLPATLPTADDLGAVRATIALAARLGLRVAAVQPVYCLEPGESARLRLLAAIRENCDLASVPPAALPGCGSPDVAWLSPAQVAERFAAFPDTIRTAGEIAASCGPVLPDGRPIWPAVTPLARPTPAAGPAAPAESGQGRDPGVASGAVSGGADEEAVDADALLAAAAQAGALEKYGPEPPTAVPARLAAELVAIARQGFAPLFLVVADIVRFARGQEIPVSTRGSVANSLVAYCVGITDVDPVAHDLLFERFLSPARVDPPDIDVDLCSRRRDEVLDYVRRRHGAERVALVGTISTLRLASAVREAGKAHGLADEEVARLAARLPRQHPQAGADEVAQALAGLIAGVEEPGARAALEDAGWLVGQPDHLGIHAGGIVIAPGPLTGVLPVQWAPKGWLVTQFEHDDVAALGLAKIDLLGIRALTVITDALALVQRYHAPHFRLASIPVDDRATGELLASGDTIGVFQCESDGARATLRKLRARTAQDLAIANAFFKPGPSTGGMATHFVRRYRGEEAASYLHPALEPILATTRGVLIFQEQVLRIAREVAGLTWQEADHLRRGMGRMQPAEMAGLRDRFLAGCRRPEPEGHGLNSEQAQQLWEQVAAFAGFGFNQGHATAYAAVSYRSAYLRAHWPAAFLCARLADSGGFHHPAVYMAEAIRLGIAVRPPHVNHSSAAFTLEPGVGAAGPALWMGLGQVRDLRQAAVAGIEAARRRKPFTGLHDLLARVDLQPREVRHLVQSGALDGLAASRAALLAEVGTAGGRKGAGGGNQPVQLAFDFAAPDVPAETLAERCAWEQHLLGIPVSALADPLALLPGGRPQPPECRPISALLGNGRQAGPMIVAGVRLPGWTGSPAFLLWDGATLASARPAKGLKAPPPWQPSLLRCRRAGDGWGNWWLVVDAIS